MESSEITVCNYEEISLNHYVTRVVLTCSCMTRVHVLGVTWAEFRLQLTKFVQTPNICITHSPTTAVLS